jgi:cytochrome c553
MNLKTNMKKILILSTILTVIALYAQAADVKENYEKHCLKCHGADGKAQTKMGVKAGAKDFTDPKVQAGMTDEKSFKAIKEGIKDGDKTKMKPAEGLSDDEIKALVAHLKTFK